MESMKVAGPVILASAVALFAGFVIGRVMSPPSGASRTVEGRERELSEDEPTPEMEGPALRTCEARLSRAEEALARLEEPHELDPAMLPQATRDALASPEASAAIEAEVDRRIAERFERERERRREEWAVRRAETRERLRAIGIDDATLTRVTPAMCAMRQVYRQAWQARRESGGGPPDGGTRGSGRRELRAQTADMRQEVSDILGPDRSSRLEDEGGMRALGTATECPDDEPPRTGRIR